MKAKKNFLEYIKEVKNIITPLEIPDNGLSDIQSQIEHAELIVPVVGGFSAGKSTLINSFLGTEILPTAVTPETALATELRYSETDYIEKPCRLLFRRGLFHTAAFQRTAYVGQQPETCMGQPERQIPSRLRR